MSGVNDETSIKTLDRMEPEIYKNSIIFTELEEYMH